MAWNNIRRNRRTFFPYILTTAIISGVYLLIGGLIFSESLSNLPSGKTASQIFSIGIVVFSIFAFFFMIYINNFIVGRRKREFGLYGILGLEKRHVGRVLVWENLITLVLGVASGVVFALVFGRLLFLVLLKMIREVAAGSVFSLAPVAYILTLILFFAVFVITSLLNRRQVRLSSPIALMSSERKGEKDSKLLIPLAIFGLLCLIVAYYYAWTIENVGMALGLFFLLAILVILATHILFRSGSIAALRALRANKRLYYKPRNFIAIGGMFQRMRQNAKSLATICILSTMFIVTVSGTLALYLGQQAMLEGKYPYEVEAYINADRGEQAILDFESAALSLADEYNVTLSADRSKLTYEAPTDGQYIRNNYVSPDSEWVDTQRLLYFDGSMRFDVNGTDADCLKYVGALRNLSVSMFDSSGISDVFTASQEGYGLFGGLLFLGVFFGILFLAVTVLIIYFKQISEGYEDKAQFAILQQVGMDDLQVKATINRQVLWVFFIPLGMTVLHMVFASRMMARMLQAFMLYDWGLVLACIGGACVVFALLYLIVYRLTAKVYYRIVKW